jgi:hypothetical protein
VLFVPDPLKPFESTNTLHIVNAYWHGAMSRDTAFFLLTKMCGIPTCLANSGLDAFAHGSYGSLRGDYQDAAADYAKKPVRFCGSR